MMIDVIFILGMFAVILGSLALSMAPYINLYVKQGYSRKDAFLMVLKSFWNN